MGDVLGLPLHLAVHVSGFAVAAGLAAYAVVHRDELGPGWLSLLVGATLVGVSSLVLGAQLAEGLAWPLYVRAAGYAGIAFGAAGRLGVAAVAVAVPASAHLVTATAGGLAAVATVGGVLGRGRQVWLLSGGLALLAAGDLVAASDPPVGAWISLVGAGLGLVWLAQRSRRSLAARFVTLFGAVLLAVVLMLASASAAVFDQDLRDDRLDLLAQQAAARSELLADDATDELAASLAVLAEGTQLSSALLQDRAGPDTAANVARLATRADLVLLLGADGSVVASYDRSTGQPAPQAATPVAGLPMVVAAREQQAPTDGLTAIELLSTGVDAPELLAVAAHPLFPRVDGQERRDQLAGLVVAASRVTRPDRLDTIATQTGADVAVLVHGRLAGTTLPTDPAVDADLEALADAAGGQVDTLGGREAFVHVEPIVGADDSRLGALVLVEDATVVADLRRTTSRSLFLAAVLGGLLATVLAGVVTDRATRPVRRLTEAAERIAEGDLTVRVDSTRTDEVGRLATAFGGMASALQAREAELRGAATREATLRERLEAVTGSMQEALVAVDGRGEVAMANPAAGALLGADPDDLVGRHLDEVLAGTDDDGEPLAAALGRPGALDTRLVRGTIVVADGRRRAVAATAAPLLTDLGEPGRVVVLRDVTSEAEVERLKTEFVSNAAHELRTPLTPVIGFADLLRRKPDLDPERRDGIVAEIADSAERLRDIVDKLIRFADLEAGRAHVAPEPTDLSSLVDEVLGDWRGRHPDRAFRRRLARRLPPVLLDPRWGRMVLDELVDNATKFSRDTVVVAARRQADGRVRIEVRDRGVGIPEEAMAEVRSEFRQADGSATRHYGGLGLGLAIVERVLDRMDGALELDSVVGQGTHVAIVLPPAP